MLSATFQPTCLPKPNLENFSQRRYARQINLPEIGEAGQKKLAQAKVLLVGAGGIGSPCALYLAAAGVGTVAIADHDRVDISNLQRQILFETNDIGIAKVQSAKAALEDLNPDVVIEALEIKITPQNAENLIKTYDVIVDGSDNIETRFLIADICARLSKTLISASVQGFMGMISTFKNEIEYRDIFPEPPPADTMPNCRDNGVLGPVAGVIGTFAAVEAIKEITQIGQSLCGKLLRYDALKGEVKISHIRATNKSAA